jgi:hypothetical protein
MAVHYWLLLITKQNMSLNGEHANEVKIGIPKAKLTVRKEKDRG